jgi:putative membrane protein
MGLYNSFLAVGLIWGLLTKREGFAIKVFFLACAIIAGIYGAATVRPSFWHQTLPAAVALLLVWLAHRSDAGSQTGSDVSR